MERTLPMAKDLVRPLRTLLLKRGRVRIQAGTAFRLRTPLAKPLVSRTAPLTAANCQCQSHHRCQPNLSPNDRICTAWFDADTERMVDGSGLTAGPSGMLGAADP